VKSRALEMKRETKETSINLRFDPDVPAQEISTGLPFFDHLLSSMAFHGRMGLRLSAVGDLEVDPHHLVEDTGLVLGAALRQCAQEHGPIARFGHAVVPMDEALGEAVVDAGGRSYLVHRADYPQEYCGRFPVALLQEFFYALAQKGGITLHLWARYGSNSHHMAEALFKSLGRALRQAYRPSGSTEPISTKGFLD